MSIGVTETGGGRPPRGRRRPAARRRVSAHGDAGGRSGSSSRVAARKPLDESFYSGDDAVALVCSGETLDVIGQIGNDPGTEWQVGGVGTADETLRRKCSVVQGDGDGGNAFDPSAEWLSLASDTFAGLGSATCAP